MYCMGEGISRGQDDHGKGVWRDGRSVFSFSFLTFLSLCFNLLMSILFLFTFPLARIDDRYIDY